MSNWNTNQGFYSKKSTYQKSLNAFELEADTINRISIPLWLFLSQMIQVTLTRHLA